MAKTEVERTKPSTANALIAEVTNPIVDMIASQLPSTIKPEKFRDVLIMAAAKEPKLFDCDLNSLRTACLQAAAAGIIPDGQYGALVPFYDNQKKMHMVQFIIMMKGFIQLFRRRSDVYSMTVEVVYEKDGFTYLEGDNPLIEHHPNKLAENRGLMVAVYGVFRDIEGRVLHREVMPRKDVIRAKAVSKVKNGPWAHWEEEMWRKTLVRRASKYLDLAEDVQAIIQQEDTLVDLSLADRRPAPVTRQGYDPFTTAAGLTSPQDEVDADGVVVEDEDGETGQASGQEDRQDDPRSEEGKGKANRPSEQEMDAAFEHGRNDALNNTRSDPAYKEGSLLAKCWSNGHAAGTKEREEKAPKADTGKKSDKGKAPDQKAPEKTPPVPDPIEAEKEGRSAYFQNMPREAPDDYQQVEKGAFFKGYDEAKAEDENGSDSR